MRTIKELLQLMLDNKKCFRIGLCGWANILCMHDLISYEEKDLIHNYIKSNPPSEANGRFYYWPAFDIEPRIKWLEKHIKLNS